MGKVPLQFRIFNELVRIDVDPPPERLRLDEVLPVLRAIDDELAAAAVRVHGQPVTCAKGCSACCRIQAAPVTPGEAYALLLLVEALPEPRRGEMLSRFADREARLAAAGLAAGFLEGRRVSGDEEAQAQARRYLDLGLACPFLEDDACGIYQERPFSCREYFVTSAKEFCVDPLSLPVRTVPGAAQAFDADLTASAEVTGQRCYTIPLTLAVAFARQHRQLLAREYDGREVFARSVANLFQSAANAHMNR
jgi:Fe-S-cluster containining protein